VAAGPFLLQESARNAVDGQLASVATAAAEKHTAMAAALKVQLAELGDKLAAQVCVLCF
jgi:hypothetical protein